MCRGCFVLYVPMIEVEIRRFIYNRMWFGFWFSYEFMNERENLLLCKEKGYGSWKRDSKHRRVPMILITDTFSSRTDGTGWSNLYDPY